MNPEVPRFLSMYLCYLCRDIAYNVKRKKLISINFNYDMLLN